MKHSYLLAGIKANRLLAMLVQNKGFSIKYFPRILFLLNAGIWSNIFAFAEKQKFKSKIEKTKIHDDPIFIVGNWRTGSTFLHQLLALDKQFTSPTVYQVSNPDHLLVSKKYYTPIMSKALGDKRPMDNVKIGVNEPQEDEYALLKLCKNTPLENLIFNRTSNTFLNSDKGFLPDNIKDFEQAIKQLTRKLTLVSGKRILYKNPFHSLRISFLRTIYPNAKFIHIYRNPEKVLPSCQHMWSIVGSQNILKNKWFPPTIEELAILYKKIITTIRNEFQSLKANQAYELKFEDFEKSPVKHIKQIYGQLQLTFTSEYEQSLIEYCNNLSDYKKNRYATPEKENQQINTIFKDVLQEYY